MDLHSAPIKKRCFSMESKPFCGLLLTTWTTVKTRLFQAFRQIVGGCLPLEAGAGVLTAWMSPLRLGVYHCRFSTLQPCRVMDPIRLHGGEYPHGSWRIIPQNHTKHLNCQYWLRRSTCNTSILYWSKTIFRIFLPYISTTRPHRLVTSISIWCLNPSLSHRSHWHRHRRRHQGRQGQADRARLRLRCHLRQHRQWKGTFALVWKVSLVVFIGDLSGKGKQPTIKQQLS